MGRICSWATDVYEIFHDTVVYKLFYAVLRVEVSILYREAGSVASIPAVGRIVDYA